jgi:transcriptional regulator with XRE-family HTH domain
MMSFGQWMYREIQQHQITVLELSDYSGISVRKLYRIISGEVSVTLYDFLWLVECLSDMTGKDKKIIVSECLGSISIFNVL